MEETLSMDQAAAEKLSEFAQATERGDQSDVMLRITVIGGGCTGFQYRLGLDTQQDERDLVFESEGRRLITDPVSFGLIKGSIISYVEGLQGAGFTVENPNVISACGCGSSFAVRDSE